MTWWTLSLHDWRNEITINSGLFSRIDEIIVTKIGKTLTKEKKPEDIIWDFCSLIWKYLAFREEEYNIHIQSKSLDLFLYEDKILFIKPIYGYPWEFYEYSISTNDNWESKCFRRWKSRDVCSPTGYWFSSFEDIEVDEFKNELEQFLNLLGHSHYSINKTS